MPLTERQRIVLEALAGRDRAEATLQALLAARAEALTVPGEQTRQDLYREVTGKSALDNAIAQTRRLIEATNTALVQAQRVPADAPALAHAADA